MGTVGDALDPDDWTDPHPAVVVSDEDTVLAAVLRQQIDNKSCSKRLRDAAIPWLARLEA